MEDIPYHFVTEGENGSASVTMRDSAYPISVDLSRRGRGRIPDQYRRDKLGVFQFRVRIHGVPHRGSRLLALLACLWTIKNEAKSGKCPWKRERMAGRTVPDVRLSAESITTS